VASSERIVARVSIHELPLSLRDAQRPYANRRGPARRILPLLGLSRRGSTSGSALSWTPDEAKDAPLKSWPTTQADPARTVPDDFGDNRDATSMTVARAFVPDVRERARRSVPMPRTQADRVADARAHSGIVFSMFRRRRPTAQHSPAWTRTPNTTALGTLAARVHVRWSAELDAGRSLRRPAPIMTNDAGQSTANGP
jgi:hypothetical protein